MNNLIFLSFFVLLIFPALIRGYGIGISPIRIDFTKNSNENYIRIFNQNSFDINYTIEGCDYNFIETIRRGTIKNKSSRDLIIRYNPRKNKDIKNCNMDIITSNNIYATGLSIFISFPDKEEENNKNNSSFLLNSDFKNNNEDYKNAEKIIKKTINWKFIGIAFVLFVIALIIIIWII